MSEQLKPLSLTILGKQYKVACPQEERSDLINTAQMLDEQMHEIQDSGKVIGSDRIAVMAALNLAHELVQLQKQGSRIDNSIEKYITQLREKIENALS